MIIKFVNGHRSDMKAYSVLTIVFAFTMRVFGDHEDRPKLVSHGGNLFIVAAQDKNITFKTEGRRSFINVDGENLIDVLKAAKNASHTLKMLSSTVLVANQPSMGLTHFNNMVNGPRGINQRLSSLESAVFQETTNNTFGNRYPLRLRYGSYGLPNLRRRVTELERKMNNLNNMLTRNECASNPCNHGGTCQDLFNGFLCTCTKNWEGPRCDADVNECASFTGTDLGCQNGATCTNEPGSYKCACGPGWFGVHCTRRLRDCTQGSAEICGHGTCVPQQSGSGIKCLCDQGWKSDGDDKPCLIDVDECTEKPQCSPLVTCINLPGTFYCSPCPKGYTGNGYHCVDVDECQVNNGGCSVNPTVQCTNTPGSRMCGPCPVGYQGDGTVCVFRGTCQINNGGCHPSAACIENPTLGTSFVQCICPSGFIGNGMGLGGCIPGVQAPTPAWMAASQCTPNTCVHGICHNIPTGYVCVCQPNYIGKNCDVLMTSCSSSPCRNGGSCHSDNTTSNGYRCDCTDGYTGRLCQLRNSVCGGLLSFAEGSIVYPAENTTYRHNSRCAWIIETTVNKVLQVNFSRFSLESSGDSNCQYDWLQIHDGRSSGSHMIGRFCGNAMPKGGSITSTHNSLYLWFRSDHNIAFSGFSLHWTTIDPVCGKSIVVQSHGQISSPGWPGKYPPNRDCFWYLTASDSSKRLQLHFFTLDIEKHRNCSYDYLAIHSGILDSEPVIAKYCNSSLPPPLTIPGPSALIHFHSDAYTDDYGFQLSYSLMEGVPGCGGLFTRKSGEITPPMDNGNYVNNVRCQYRITLLPGYQIQLAFLAFDLEWGCSYDYVSIYDGPSEESKLVGTYCGSDIPPPFITSSNEATIIFNSDYSISGNGFKLTYSLVCTRTFSEDSGSFTSPGYPEMYPDNHRCIYTIATKQGTVIELSFVDFDIEGDAESCDFDSLEIRDGDNANSTLLGTYCGTGDEMPPRTISRSNYLTLVLSSDESIGGTGFSVNYTTIDRGCGATLKDFIGVISHPSNGSSYMNNMHCTWIISAPAGYSIQINWLAIDLEKISDTDYVELWENSTVNGAAQKIGRYFGDRLPPTVNSKTNLVTVFFHSDMTFSGGGFTFSYLFIDNSKVCGGNFSTSSGTLTSPGFPGEYPDRKDCTWIITAPIGIQILLNVTFFNLESGGSRCYSDYLEIRNGGYKESPLIGKYCGDTIIKKIPSSGNQLFLHFHSDISISKGGFSIDWDATSTGCGGSLASSTGSIISPNYPQPYGYSTECYWKVSTSQGSKIRFVFDDLEMEPNEICSYDYLEIFDGIDDNSPSLGKFCSLAAVPHYINTTTNYAFLKFHSDITQAGRGFSLLYESVCRNTISGFQGVIESPNFPSPYPNRANCEWNITVPRGNRINASFSHFSLESSLEIDTSVIMPSILTNWMPYVNYSTCQFDRLEIKDGKDISYEATYCGETLPPRFKSTDNHLYVHFVTDSFLGFSGFRLEWILDGCGGIMTRSSDELTSPNYPYTSNADCEWYINVSPGSSIELTIFDFHSSLRVCNTTYDLTVYNGPDDKSLPLIQQCAHKTPFTVTSTSNHMFVRYNPNENSGSIGLFRAEYVSKPASCGGKFTANYGTIMSPNYPKNYMSHVLCYWYIEVPKNHLISFAFNDVDLFSSIGLLCPDFVKIYNGNEPNDKKVILKVCGSGVPKNSTFVSKSNQLLVELKSGGLLGAKGFSARYEVACGARIIADNTGEIVHNALSGNRNTDNCTWTIIASRPSLKVSLTITNMMFAPEGLYSPNCSKIFINVFNGDSVTAPKIGTYCGTKVPPTIVSYGDALTIQTRSSYEKNWGEFSAQYSVLRSACGAQLTSESGTIASPQYPNSYPINSDCIWTLNTSPGNRLSLVFEKFDIDLSDNCDQDYVEIRETNGVGTLLGLYCGNEVPTNVSVGNKLWIKFHSDNQGTAPGFVAHYEFVHGNDIQGQSSGQISSPLYPNPFTRSGHFTWRITVNNTNQVFINVIFLQMTNDNCQLSYLAIYDGYDETSPEISKLCGFYSEKHSITTSSNVAFIEFKTESSAHGNSFILDWRQVTNVEPGPRPPSNTTIAKCGAPNIISLRSGMRFDLSSPGYAVKDVYDDNLFCEWVFTVEMSNHLEIKFTVVDLEESEGCYMDKISVFTSDDNAATWRQLSHDICLQNATQDPPLNGTNYLKVTFVTDYLIGKTGFTASVSAVCGGEFKAPSGIIEFSNMTNLRGYARDGFGRTIHCQWLVTVRPGKTIKLHFENFNITNKQPDTCNNYLMLRNGGSKDSPMLNRGKYCGASAPNDMETFGNQVFIEINYNDRSINILNYLRRDRFKLKFEEKSVDCSGSHSLFSPSDYVIISSPNYPEIPPAHSECIWTVMGPPRERLQLNFIDRFDLDPDCNKEYVELRDGGTEFSPLLGTYCKEAPHTQKTTGNLLYIKFFTDVTDPRNGFRANVTVDDCGGTVKGVYGVIESPGYPGSTNMVANKVCKWHIIGPPDHNLWINFLDISFDWWFAASCTLKLQLFDVVANNVTSIGEPICSNGSRSSIQTASNEAIVEFTVGSLNAYNRIRQLVRGFRISFNATKIVCGGHINRPDGFLVSPGYPKGLTTNRFCEWSIVVPEDRRVTVEILDIDLGGPTLLMQPLLGFYNDFDYKALIRNVRMGDNITTIESSDNKLLLFYRSWQSNTHRGFKARFSSDKPTLCEGNLNGDNGTIIPPSILYNTSSFFCQWRRKVDVDDTDDTLIDDPIGQTFVMVFKNAKIGRKVGSCRFSSSSVIILGYFLPISTALNRLTLQQLCGDYQMPVVVRSPSSAVAVQATQGKSATVEFQLEYKVQPCGGMVRDVEEDFFLLPRNHTGSLDCAWMLTAPEGKTLKVTLVKSEFSDEHCDAEFLVIYNGFTPTSPALTSYCHSRTSNVVSHSQTNYLWIEYHSNSYSLKTNLKLKLEVEGSDCGAMSNNRNFKSPNFPSSYEENKECSWEIRTDTGSRISLTFETRFNIEKSPNCTKDFVEIFDYANQKWQSLGRECGRILPPSYNSTGNRMKVMFRSDAAVNGDGFSARWSPFCGGSFVATDEIQYLVSPGWPSRYRGHLNCEYNITGDGEHHVLLSTVVFDLEADRNCRSDNLSITAHNVYGDEMSTYCGRISIPDFREIRGFNLIFKTDTWIQKRGFRLAYRLEQCGGNVTSPQLLNSPVGRNGKYYDNLNCIWNITAPEDKIIILRFNKLSMESSLTSYNCDMDHVSVYEGLSIDSKDRLGQFCGNLTYRPPIVRSKSNKMTIQMITDVYLGLEGFEVDVTFMFDESTGCGGTIELSESNTKQFTTPALQHGSLFYEPFLDCQWHIKAPPSHVIKINFTSLHIAPCFASNHSQECCDFLEFHDGPTSASILIGRFCGHPIPAPIVTSSSSTVWARFFTDGTSTSTGFKITLSAILSPCGNQDLSVTEHAADLLSPGFATGDIPRGLSCSWLLKSREEIAIKIMVVDLVPADAITNHCLTDRLEIIDFRINALHNSYQGQEFVISGKSDIANQQGPIMTMCSLREPITVYPKDNVVMVRLITSPNKSGSKHKGIMLQYSTIKCIPNYTELQGRINARASSNCTSLIAVPSNRTISISLSYLHYTDFLGEPSCDAGKLEIRDGNAMSSPIISTICGDNKVNPIFSTGPNLMIVLTATYDLEFDMQYFSTDAGQGCGGIINGQEGTVYSPLYPSTYRSVKVCEWIVTSSSGSLLNLNFDAFDLGSRLTCNKNYLELLDRDGFPARRYCGDDNPALYTSRDNYVKLVYHTALNNGGIGWHATFNGTRISTREL